MDEVIAITERAVIHHVQCLGRACGTRKFASEIFDDVNAWLYKIMDPSSEEWLNFHAPVRVHMRGPGLEIGVVRRGDNYNIWVFNFPRMIYKLNQWAARCLALNDECKILDFVGDHLHHEIFCRGMPMNNEIVENVFARLRGRAEYVRGQLDIYQ